MSESDIQLKSCFFSELQNEELLNLLCLRAEVFVVEQNCVYQDPDFLDAKAYHILLRGNEKLIGCARILPPGSHYEEVAIGRVVVAQNHRGKNLGKRLFQFCLDECKRLFLNQNIRIMAQSYLINFYKDFRFEVQGDEFLEDGIPHVYMLYTPNKTH